MSPKIFKIINRQRFNSELKDKTSDPFVVKEGKFRDSRLKDSLYYSDWTEESFLSDSGQKETVRLTFDTAKLKYFAWLAALVFSTTGTCFSFPKNQG